MLPKNIRACLLLAASALLIIVVAGCSDEDNTSPTAPGDSEMSDTELIAAIQNVSNTTEIDVADLPEASRAVLQDDFVDYNAVAARHAVSLGYQVDLDGVGERVGFTLDLYFAEDGRRLRTDDGDVEDEREPCFEVVMPFAFVMPDGSTIEITAEGDYQLVRAWQIANPDLEGDPVYQFPVDIDYGEGPVVTINDELELRQAYADCREGGDDGGDHAEPCFEVVIPFTFVMPDGSTIEITAEGDYQLIVSRQLK